MSKGLAVLGLAVVGFGLALVSTKAKASPLPEPEGPEDEPEEPAVEEPNGGSPPGAGNGSVELFELIPEAVRNIDLSGNELYRYDGLAPYGFLQLKFHKWTVTDSLNGLPVEIFRGETNANDWIAFFWKQDPPGSTPEAHAIVYKISPTASEQHKAWMLKNIAGLE